MLIHVSVDVMHSCCSNKPPLLFQVERAVLRDTRADDEKICFQHSPLRVVKSPEFHVGMPIAELRCSLDILRDAFNGFEMLYTEIIDGKMAYNEESRFRQYRSKMWERLRIDSNPETDPIPTTVQEKVQEVVRLAAIIHFGAVVSRIQHGDASNTVCVCRLHDLLKGLRLDFWQPAPYLYLWMYVHGSR